MYAPAPWRLFYTAFRDLRPVAVIGNSIHVYWIERWPEVVGHRDRDFDVDADRSLGDALLFGFQWPEHAHLHYQRYLEERPGDANVLVNYGRALMATNQVETGVAALERAVNADGNHGLARVTLGHALLTQRDVHGAAEHAERAVALVPNSAEAHLLIGRVYAMRGQFENAAHAFARVIEIDPEQADAREYLRRIATMRSAQVRSQKQFKATR